MELLNISMYSNISTQYEVPLHSSNVHFQVIVYSFLSIFGSYGNLTVLYSLYRSRHRKSRISLMILHLTIADLVVTIIMVPVEIGWRITLQWRAGNIACKLFAVIRVFGLYLSSSVLVCISLDRYFAILHPLKVNAARRRGKIMLAIAWTVSLICAFPQSIVFHVATPPTDPNFYQCVTFGTFSSDINELLYNLFCVSVMYFAPLLIIIFVYSRILLEITRKSRETEEDSNRNESKNSKRRSDRMLLRRSDISNIARARSRTLFMTILIVLAFIWCWTPYVVMTLWYMFDRDSALRVNAWVQDALFIMAVSNSCMNPMVYGRYIHRSWRECFCSGFYCTESQFTRRSTVSGAHRTQWNNNNCENKSESNVGGSHNLFSSITRGRTAWNRITVYGKLCSFKEYPSRNSLGGVKLDVSQVPHSDIILPTEEDSDSGVSISYRGRPYHSDPLHQGVELDLSFFRSDSHHAGLCYFKNNRTTTKDFERSSEL